MNYNYKVGDRVIRRKTGKKAIVTSINEHKQMFVKWVDLECMDAEGLFYMTAFDYDLDHLKHKIKDRSDLTSIKSIISI